MSRQVILNGRPHDLDYEPSLKVGQLPNWRTPVIINGKMVHGVNLNGYDYPPADSGCVLYLPGLPGYGAAIWDRSGNNNHGAIVGAGWTRSPGGVWGLSLDQTDDRIDFSAVTGFLGATGTVMFWVKTGFAYDAAAPPDGEWRLVSLVDGANDRIIDLYYDPTLDLFSNYAVGPSFVSSAVQSFTINSYIHFAYTWDSAVEQALFVDTVRTVDVGVWAEKIPATLKLGCYNNNTDEWLGHIYLFSAHSTVLSNATITSRRNQERHLFGV